MPFRIVELGALLTVVDSIRFRSPLQGAWENLDHDMIFRNPLRSSDGVACAIHDGNLHVAGDFEAPAFHVLIRGDLVVEGLIDSSFKDANGGGTFIVTGSVRCRSFMNEYGKAEIIGEDLAVEEMLFNAFPDSLLYVGGTITARFFFGWDMWAEFGVKAEMEYGVGYCLPFNHFDSSEGVEAFFDEATSLDRLAITDADNLSTDEIAAYLRSGKPIFREL
jgi:hypothetical protein